VFTTREQKNQTLPCTVKIQEKSRITFFGYRSGSSHGRFAIKKINLKKKRIHVFDWWLCYEKKYKKIKPELLSITYNI